MHTREMLSLLKEDFFIPDIKGQTKDEVLDELVQPLIDNEVIKNKKLLLNTLKQRETLGSTGIGKGVAIPHCRTLTVPDIQIVVGLSKSGVPYESVDQEPVHLFFLIIAPPKEESCLYLPILGALVEKLNDDKIRKQLLETKEFNGFVQVIAGGE